MRKNSINKMDSDMLYMCSHDMYRTLYENKTKTVHDTPINKKEVCITKKNVFHSKHAN